MVTEFDTSQLHRLRLLRMTWGLRLCWVLTSISNAHPGRAVQLHVFDLSIYLGNPQTFDHAKFLWPVDITFPAFLSENNTDLNSWPLLTPGNVPPFGAASYNFDVAPYGPGPLDVAAYNFASVDCAPVEVAPVEVAMTVHKRASSLTTTEPRCDFPPRTLCDTSITASPYKKRVHGRKVDTETQLKLESTEELIKKSKKRTRQLEERKEKLSRKAGKAKISQRCVLLHRQVIATDQPLPSSVR